MARHPNLTGLGASDGDSGLAGYCPYIGTDQTANPTTTKGMFGTSPVLTGDKCQYIVSASTLDLSSPGILASAPHEQQRLLLPRERYRQSWQYINRH